MSEIRLERGSIIGNIFDVNELGLIQGVSKEVYDLVKGLVHELEYLENSSFVCSKQFVVGVTAANLKATIQENHPEEVYSTFLNNFAAFEGSNQSGGNYVMMIARKNTEFRQTRHVIVLHIREEEDIYDCFIYSSVLDILPSTTRIVITAGAVASALFGAFILDTGLFLMTFTAGITLGFHSTRSAFPKNIEIAMDALLVNEMMKMGWLKDQGDKFQLCLSFEHSNSTEDSNPN